MSTGTTSNQRKLKVKFVGHLRDYVQCRKTKVRITTQPRFIKDRIKHYRDSIRDLENILEVLEQVDLKNDRPSVGELLCTQYNSDPEQWNKITDDGRAFWQGVAEQFIESLQRELYLTEYLQPGEADDYFTYKKDTTKAIQEILERR